jgi:hypothetical protein
MVNTVSTLGFSAASTDALANDAPGKDASPIQSSGMTKRAKTFPLSPLPFSPAGARRALGAEVTMVLSDEGPPAEGDEVFPPEDATVVWIESA